MVNIHILNFCGGLQLIFSSGCYAISYMFRFSGCEWDILLLCTENLSVEKISVLAVFLFWLSPVKVLC